MRIHQNSPLGQLETLYESNICPLCLMWGEFKLKERNRLLCYLHMSTPPVGFKCPAWKVTDGEIKCYYKQASEGICPEHSLDLVPYWPHNPENEHLIGKPKIKKWIYAQAAQGRGLSRGLELVDRIGEIYSVSGQVILDQAIEIRKIERMLKGE